LTDGDNAYIIMVRDNLNYWGYHTMRNLILVLVAFIAVVTFIRAYDGSQTGVGDSSRQTTVESSVLDD